MEPAEAYLERVEAFLEPRILEKRNLSVYARRAEKIGVSLLEIRQSHLGTDGGLELIKRARRPGSRASGRASCPCGEQNGRGRARTRAVFARSTRATRTRSRRASASSRRRERSPIATSSSRPAAAGSPSSKEVMNEAGVSFTDNAVDVGIRVETRQERYPIVADYYDPKFLFPRRRAPSARTRARPTSSRKNTRRRTGAPGIASTATPGPSPAPRPAAGARTWRRRLRGSAADRLRRARLRSRRRVPRTASSTSPSSRPSPSPSPSPRARTTPVCSGYRPPSSAGGRPIMQRVGDFRLGQAILQGAFLGRPLRLRTYPGLGHAWRHQPLRARQGDARDLERDEAPRYDRAGPPAPEHDHVLSRDQALREPARLRRRLFHGRCPDSTSSATARARAAASRRLGLPACGRRTEYWRRESSDARPPHPLSAAPRFR